MQLTRFDRWLREKFVYEIHIYTLRPPVSLPAGIRVEELPPGPGKRFKHLFVARSSIAADRLITHLKEENQMYSTRIVDRNSWYTPFIAPKNKSVTWWLVSAAFIVMSGLSALKYAASLANDPEFRKNFDEAIQIMKG